MPIQRNQLPSVAGFDRHLYVGEGLDRMSKRFGRWVLGAGFLAVHLSLFATSLLAAYCWTMIQHPGDIQSLSGFRYWGIVVVVHTILTGGGLLAWHLLGMGESPVHTVVPAYAVSAGRRSVPPTMVQATATSARSQTRQAKNSQPWASRPVEQNWPHQPGYMRTSASIEPDLGEATWPDSAPLSTTLGVNTATQLTDDVVSVDPAGSAPDSWIDGVINDRQPGKKDEQRWSWIEAAAASWLSRRDVQVDQPVSPDTTVASAETSPGEPVADAETDQPQVAD